MPEVRRSNPKAFQTLENNLKELARVQTRVGWFESSKYEDGTPVAYAAALNELGHSSTPPRPFMRPTASEEEKKWSKITKDQALQIVKGKQTAFDAMDILGQAAEDDIYRKIVSIYEPELSPITIELRAMKKRNPDLVITGATVGEAARRVHELGYVTPNVSTKPLNDTGNLLKSLIHITEKV